MTESEIRAKLAALDEEIAKAGTVSATTFEGQSTTFAPIDDRLKLRAHYERLLKAAQGATTTRFGAFDKGV
jgi:hypothetical protein